VLTAALILAVALAAEVVSLYVMPFARCRRCRGARHIMRGTKRKPRPVTCPRCKGTGREQRAGSRTVHQLARRVRRELHRKRSLPERTVPDADLHR
jgi:DnaJ-class molecular chaperone